MPGIHKNNTISFRPNDWERELIDAKVKLSGMQKREFFVRACIYSRVVVVGKKENIRTIVSAVETMRLELKAMVDAIMQQDMDSRALKIMEKRDKYLALSTAIVDILNGAAYLFDGKKPMDTR